VCLCVQLQKEQKSIYGAERQLSVNAPTRFSITYRLLSDILASKDALIQAVSKHDWDILTSRIGSTEDMRKLVQGLPPERTCFMDYVETLCELLKPFAEAVYEIEADCPLLSACYPMMRQLCEHTKNWVAKYKRRKNGERLTKHTMQTF
jgi:hypothetical protein